MNKVEAIRDFLTQAGAAHGVYEEAELKGVYDQDWAIWYARWVVEHGFNNHLSEPVTPEALSVLLSDLQKEHKATESVQFWADFYAERLVEKLL